MVYVFAVNTDYQYKITLPSVDKCDGQATIVFSKVTLLLLCNWQGKKRPGFDMNLKISWSAACDTEEEDASGFVIVNEVSIHFHL